MDHLKDTVDPDMKVFAVYCSTKDKDVYTQAIVHVPEQKTVYRDGDNSFRKFHEFPGHHGWKVAPDYRLLFHSKAVKVARGEPDEPGKLADRFSRMLQTWLFFGLIYTVVCYDDDSPILRFHDLVGAGDILTTCKLEWALERWYKAVMARKRKNHDQARLYMVKVESVLHRAKMVVRKNLGLHNGEVLYSCAESDRERYVTDELALCLMVLGETLCAWKARVMESSKTFIRGWHDKEEDDGWGPPRLVSDNMKTDGWCNRAVHLLQSQLRSSATLLLAAYLSYGKNAQLKQGRHRDVCTPQVCKVVEDGRLDKYETAHLLNHTWSDKDQCKTVEADMSEILKILAKEDGKAVPLLQIHIEKEDGKKKFVLKVHDLSDMDWKAQYGAISHVWADGWGNEQGNWLWSCQIDLIFSMLQKAARKRNIPIPDPEVSIPFWMDTLIIPVTARAADCDKRLREMGLFMGETTARALRTKAIEQIGTVYPRANFTVILDNGLSSLQFRSSPSCQSGMSILASNWMKRLWTLQEAVLSRKLFITCKPTDQDVSGIVDVEEVLDELSEASNGVGARSFTSLTRKHLTDSIMHSARKKADDYSGEFKVQDPFVLLVDSWRAARWRTTSNEAHEALALATLMNLPYAEERDSRIKNASLPVDPSDVNSKTERRDLLAKEFWTLFDREYEGNIPSGLIFLPGPKVQLRGFGWAPRTFMEAYKLDYADPFTRNPKPTKLSPEFGLKVHYPGIILHCTLGDAIRGLILGTDWNSANDKSFSFPVDRYQWYTIQPADKATPPNLNGILSRRTRLAIIMTRPNPREQPKEIALLVEIYKEVGEGGDSVTYYCQILRRMKIWLDVLSTLPSDVNKSASAKRMSVNSQLTSTTTQQEDNAAPDTAESASDESGLTCLGEVLDPSQAWYVDGIVDDREDGLPEFRRSAASQPPPGSDMIIATLQRPNRGASRQPLLPQLIEHRQGQWTENNHQPQGTASAPAHQSPPSPPLAQPSRQQTTPAESEPPPRPGLLARSSTYQIGRERLRSMGRQVERVFRPIIRNRQEIQTEPIAES